MFGGLTKTSSRIAIAAALGMTLGGYAMSTPAKAADLGGDCCADLEERVAELEATTVRKGNKKVSVTLSGWVVKAINFWDDGKRTDTWIGDKDADLTSRFAITGQATIAPGWTGGYNITVTAPGNFIDNANQTGGNVFGIASNQFGQDSGLLSGINTLYSYMFIKSDNYGAINWGYLSPASDNPAVLADLSGTVIESNAVLFESPSFFLRPNGAGGGGGDFASLSGFTIGNFTNCNSGIGPIGVDCYGAPQSGVRYDSPTFGGFRFEVSYTDYLGNLLTSKGPVLNGSAGLGAYATTPEAYDAALFYTGDWGNFKVSAAYSYTHLNAAVGSADINETNEIHQVGATVMHVPSGIGLYGMYQNDRVEDGRFVNAVTGSVQRTPESDAWYLKPFIKRTWSPIGATVLFGEYAQYEDQFGGLAGANVCGLAGPLAGTASCASGATVAGMFVNDSEVERWGLGVMQEIDSAAMHLFARWQHMDVDVDFTGLSAGGTLSNVNQDFDDFDLFQVGGIIFF